MKTGAADDAIAKFEERQASKKPKTIGQKIREQVEAAVEAGDSRIVPPFRTIPRELRPRAVTRAKLRGTKIGPIFGEPPPPTPVPIEVVIHRSERRRRHRIASASMRRNRK